MDAAHKVTRPNVDARAFYGFILKKSDRLTLFAEECDFLLDGCRLVRNEDVAVCKVTPSSRHCSRVMKKESLLGGLDSIPDVDLTIHQKYLKTA